MCRWNKQVELSVKKVFSSFCNCIFWLLIWRLLEEGCEKRLLEEDKSSETSIAKSEGNVCVVSFVVETGCEVVESISFQST